MNTKEFEEKYAAIAAYLADPTTNPNVNVEEIEEGDTITILGVPDKVTEGNVNGVERKWLTVNCSGSRSSISLASLVGTAKHEKIFGEEKAKLPNLIKLPHGKMEAIIEIEEKLVGKTLKCVGKQEWENPRFDSTQTFYLWQIVA